MLHARRVGEGLLHLEGWDGGKQSHMNVFAAIEQVVIIFATRREYRYGVTVALEGDEVKVTVQNPPPGTIP